MNTIRVAITDDQRLFRVGLRFIISSFDNLEIVLEAEHGQDLLEKLPSNSVDVILLDMEMPVLDGYETTLQVKEQYPDVKILMLSMHNDEHLIARMMEVGANGYLLKDESPDILKQAIEQVIENDYFFTKYIMESMIKSRVNPKKQKGNPMSQSAVHLTTREIEILLLICQQKTSKEIADELFIAPVTVNDHRKNLLSKTQSRNTAGLVIYAIKHGYCKA